MTVKNFFASLLGFETTAAAVIKREVGQIEASASAIAAKVESEASIASTPATAAVPLAIPSKSTVAAMAAQLVKVAGNYGAKIDSLETTRLSVVEDLRQNRAARAATVSALLVLQDDPAVDADTRTAIHLEVDDHTTDVASAAVEAAPVGKDDAANGTFPNA